LVSLLVSAPFSDTVLRADPLFSHDQGLENSRGSSGAIYSLMKKESRNVNATYTDLSTVLRLNGPSQAEKKRQSDALGSDDPVIEHLMRSKALKAVFLGLIAAVLGWGIAIIVLVEMGGAQYRTDLLAFAGAPCLGAWVPATALFAMMCSRRLR
jgi:hypothetical protein